jgi:hypothetical protein
VSGKPAYARRKPEATALHQVVRDDPWKSQKCSRLIASFLTQPEADLQQ